MIVLLLPLLLTLLLPLLLLLLPLLLLLLLLRGSLGHLLKHCSPRPSTSVCTFPLAHVALTVLISSVTRHAQEGEVGSAQLPSFVVEYLQRIAEKEPPYTSIHRLW